MGPFRDDFKLAARSGGLGCVFARGVAEARASESARSIRFDRHSPKPARLDVSIDPRVRIGR
jgi:hypothetical protein